MADDIVLDDVNVTAPAPAPPAAPAAPSSSPYAVRQINLTFKLGTGSFGTTGSNTITVTGLRVICYVEQAVNPTMTSSLTMKVYGLTLDHMNALSVAGLLWNARDNQVLVQAGDSVAGMTTVFNGQIVEAYPKLSSAQDAHFFVSGQPTQLVALKPVAPTSYPGAVSAASAIQSMAQRAGFGFQNNGVSAVLSAPYFPGTAWTQIQAAVRAAGCFAYLNDTTNTLSIWPKNAAPPSSGIVVSPQTGMIGYPEFQKSKIVVRTLFSPQVVASPGTAVTVQSQLKAANNAKLTVVAVTHDLASQMPDGPWETTIVGQPPL